MEKMQPGKLLQKIPLGKLPARKLAIAGGAVLVLIAGALAFSPAVRESLACSESTEVQFSPGGKYRAQLTEKICSWGVGQAPRLTEVRVDKQEKDGWAVVLPLEVDGDSPAIKWKGGHALDVTVYSSEVTGALVRRIDELAVTRRYVKAPKGKAGKSD